jgi:general secretion pathway protein J
MDARPVMSLRCHSSGFTLLEVLIAVAIFVVVGAMAMGGYNKLSDQSRMLDERMLRVRAVQNTMTKFALDFEQLEPRPIQDALGQGNRQPALLASASNGQQGVVELSRAGWNNPAGVQRSTLERVTYRLVDKKLLRDRWPVMDRLLTNEPQTTTLLDRVKGIKLRFMDQNRTWQEQWPGANTPSINSARALPLAVEITLELEDWGVITRLIEVPS